MEVEMINTFKRGLDDCLKDTCRDAELDWNSLNCSTTWQRGLDEADWPNGILRQNDDGSTFYI